MKPVSLYDDDDQSPVADSAPIRIIEPEPMQPSKPAAPATDTIHGVPRRFLQAGYYSVRD